MTGNTSSEHAKNPLPKACLFLQERTARCLLLVSALCLAGGESNKSESPESQMSSMERRGQTLA